MSHRGPGPGRVNLQIPEPVVEVRFDKHFRAAVDHWSTVRGTLVAAKVWHRSAAVRTTTSSSSTSTATPSSAVVTTEPRVVTTTVLGLLLRRGGLLRNEHRGVCGQIVARWKGERNNCLVGMFD